MIEKVEMYVASCNKCSMPFPDDEGPIAMNSEEELADHIMASEWAIVGMLAYNPPAIVMCPKCLKKEE